MITGATGQDGAYLAELLLAKGYTVHGIKRRSSSFNTARVDHLYRDPHGAGVRFFLHYGDMTDSTNLIRIIQEVQPTEIYNLAAQSHVRVSFETPEYTANSDALGTLRLLEAIRILRMEDKVRFYQASTSELYGMVQEVPQRETTPFYPRSPYAVAKLYAYWITVNYREAYKMHASNGILFNHEGPTRGETFVTRKISRAVAAIELGLQDKLFLGNLSARRDWGHARDYVEGMWLMLQQPEPDDYVLATGEEHSVREFVEKAFGCIGRKIEWRGSGVAEQGVDARDGRVLDRDRSALFPPHRNRRASWRSEQGAAKARLEAQSQSFDQLVREMVETDLERDAPRRRASQCARLRRNRPSEATVSEAPVIFDLNGKRVFVDRPCRHGRLRDRAAAARRELRDHHRAAQGARSAQFRTGRALHGEDEARRRLCRRRQGRRHPRQQHLPGRIHRRQSRHRAQHHPRGPQQQRQEARLSRLVLHLSARGAAADAAGHAADRRRSSRPTNGTASPRSPASNCAKPIACNTARTSYR